MFLKNAHCTFEPSANMLTWKLQEVIYNAFPKLAQNTLEFPAQKKAGKWMRHKQRPWQSAHFFSLYTLQQQK
jgi:hypothetical protein